MASIKLASHLGDVVCIPITRFAAVTATGEIATEVAPFKGRIVGVTARAEAISPAGDSVPSDVDLMLEIGGTDCLGAVIAVVDAATCSSPTTGTLSTTDIDISFEAGEVFHLDCQTFDGAETGGATASVTGISANVYCVRD